MPFDFAQDPHHPAEPGRPRLLPPPLRRPRPRYRIVGGGVRRSRTAALAARDGVAPRPGPSDSAMAALSAQAVIAQDLVNLVESVPERDLRSSRELAVADAAMWRSLAQLAGSRPASGGPGSAVRATGS